MSSWCGNEWKFIIIEIGSIFDFYQFCHKLRGLSKFKFYLLRNLVLFITMIRYALYNISDCFVVFTANTSQYVYNFAIKSFFFNVKVHFKIFMLTNTDHPLPTYILHFVKLWRESKVKENNLISFLLWGPMPLRLFCLLVSTTVP